MRYFVVAYFNLGKGIRTSQKTVVVMGIVIDTLEVIPMMVVHNVVIKMVILTESIGGITEDSRFVN